VPNLILPVKTRANPVETRPFRAGKFGSKFGRAFGIVPSASLHQGSQITHPGALHNAEVPSSASIAERNYWPIRLIPAVAS
jgi:hypothetical protein